MIFLKTWGLIISAAFLDVLAIIIIKIRLNYLGPINYESAGSIFQYILDVLKTPQTFASAIFLVITPGLFGFALSRMNLNLVYPILIALTTIFIIIGSAIFLKEPVTIKKLIGIAIILIGIFVVYSK